MSGVDKSEDKRPERSGQQPKSTPREQKGTSTVVGPGPSGEEQTDDQDNLHNNVSHVGDSDPGK